LHRALAQLRARLDRDHGGRSAWVLAMTPLTAAAPSGLLSSTTAGATLVTTGTKVALASIVTISAFLAVLWRVSRPAEVRSQAEKPAVQMARAAAEVETSAQVEAGDARLEIAEAKVEESTEAIAPEPVAGPSEMLAEMRADLLTAMESSLSGEMDPGLFLDMALLLVELEPGRAIPEPSPVGVRFPLQGVPAGMRAEFVVCAAGPTNTTRFGSVLAMHVTMDKPTEHYVVDGQPRRNPYVHVNVWTDRTTGAVKHFGVLTSLGHHRILPPGRSADGLLYSLDTSKPFEPHSSLGGINNGQPTEWPAQLSLVGGPWPRLDDIERHSQGLSKQHAKLKE
jgi:hypothetical protein